MDRLCWGGIGNYTPLGHCAPMSPDMGYCTPCAYFPRVADLEVGAVAVEHCAPPGSAGVLKSQYPMSGGLIVSPPKISLDWHLTHLLEVPDTCLVPTIARCHPSMKLWQYDDDDEVSCANAYSVRGTRQVSCVWGAGQVSGVGHTPSSIVRHQTQT